VDGLTQDRDFKQKQSMDLISRMKMCQERLAQIALRPNVMPSEQYLQMMIENEQRGQKPGYCARIKALEDLKQRSELVKKIQKGLRFHGRIQVRSPDCSWTTHCFQGALQEGREGTALALEWSLLLKFFHWVFLIFARNFFRQLSLGRCLPRLYSSPNIS